MTRFWHRRSSEAIALVVGVFAALFAWELFADTSSLTQLVSVPFIAGCLATLTLVVVGISYFVVPLPLLRQSALLNYLLLASTVVTLVIQTGGLASTYLSIFVAVVGFAGFFGLGGIVIGAASFAIFCMQQYLGGQLAESHVVMLSLLGGLPLLCSFIVWNRTSLQAEQETEEDRSYNELASELSQVSGKAEVVINAIGEGVLALSSKGIVELMNPAAEQLLGWDKHDAVTLTYKSVLKMKDTKNQLVSDQNDPVVQALSNNKPLKNDNFSLETHSGKSFLASITVNPVGQLGQGVIVVFRDITTEKTDERQRAEFISTASHEMRTPVASIEGYLGLALNPQTANIDQKAREFITKAHESAQHLGRLFADLLDVSKADDSRLKNDPKVVDVVPFISDIVQGLIPKATEKGLRVLYKPTVDNLQNNSTVVNARTISPVFYANVDNDHLREVVQNLVENAIKYTPKGSVTVDITGDSSRIIISITDTGIGIPREDQVHLFQKFYRVDNSDTREIGGTGLGLYLCRRLCETIGGRIWVESQYKHGSTFFVEIPRIDHDDAQRLIEQASLEAERGEATLALPSDTPPPVAAPAVVPPAPVPASVLPQPTVLAPPVTPTVQAPVSAQVAPVPISIPTPVAAAARDRGNGPIIIPPR